MAKSGDVCDKCNVGRLYVATSARACGGKYQVRTLRCGKCNKFHDDREIVLAENVRRRA